MFERVSKLVAKRALIDFFLGTDVNLLFTVSPIQNPFI